MSYPLRKIRLGLCIVAAFLVAKVGVAQKKQTGSAGASQQISASDARLLEGALKAYDERNDAAAEPILRELSTRYIGNYAINEALGSLYAEAGDAQRALPYLQRAATVAPKEAAAHANLGAALLKLQRGPDAVHELQTAVKLDPANGATQANLGQALLLVKQPAQAAKALTLASQAAPADDAVKYNLALALYESGENQKAALVLRSVPAASTTVEMYSLAADAEERAGDYVNALAHYEAAARMDASDANLYALTVELLRHWNWDEAIKVSEFASGRYPGSRRFKMALGIAYYGKSDYSPAVQTFAALLEQDPADGAVADLLGRSCSALTDGEESGCRGIYEFAQSHPGNAVMMTYGAVALLHAAQGKQNLDQAAALLQAAMKADPAYPEAYLRMGVLEQMRSHWAESAALLERSIALNPKSAEAHYRLSRAYVRMGKREEAQTELNLRELYTKQAKESLDAKMQEVMRFVINPG